MENKVYQESHCTIVECNKGKDTLCKKFDPNAVGKDIHFKQVKYAKGGEYIPSKIIDIDDNQEYVVKQDSKGACYYVTDDAINYIILG